MSLTKHFFLGKENFSSGQFPALNKKEVQKSIRYLEKSYLQEELSQNIFIGLSEDLIGFLIEDELIKKISSKSEKYLY